MANLKNIFDQNLNVLSCWILQEIKIVPDKIQHSVTFPWTRDFPHCLLQRPMCNTRSYKRDSTIQGTGEPVKSMLVFYYIYNYEDTLNKTETYLNDATESRGLSNVDSLVSLL